MLDKSDRLRLLGQWVPERGSLRIEEAAGLLECSSMTVRRDVGGAPDRFVLLGGHIVVAGPGRLYDLNRELTVNVQAKEAVCANAIARLDDGDTIFIDGGTTTPPMANRLPANLRLTVVCYALNISRASGPPFERAVDPVGRALHRVVGFVRGRGRFERAFSARDQQSVPLGGGSARDARRHNFEFSRGRDQAGRDRRGLGKAPARRCDEVWQGRAGGVRRARRIRHHHRVSAPDPGPEVERLGERLFVA